LLFGRSTNGLRGVVGCQGGEHLAADVRRKARPYLPGVVQLPALVVADQQRVDTVGARAIAANDKLLLLIELELHPRAAALPGVVSRVAPLGYHPFESESVPDGESPPAPRASMRR
jgi:hypothetical protein